MQVNDTRNRHVGDGIAAITGLRAGAEEDAGWHEGSDQSVFMQHVTRYLPFQRTTQVVPFNSNQTSGSMISVALQKNLVWMWRFIISMNWPAIKSVDPNAEYTWVNCRGFAAINRVAFRAGNIPFFTISGEVMHGIAASTGFLDTWAVQLGCANTTQELINMSNFPSATQTPLFTFGNWNSSGATLGKPVTLNQMNLDLTTKPLSDLIAPIGKCQLTLSNIVMYHKSSNNDTTSTWIPLDNSAINYNLIYNAAEVSQREKAAIEANEVHKHYKEYNVVQEHTIARSDTETTENIEFSCLGPTSMFYIIITKDRTDNKLKWGRTFEDDGSCFVKDVMIYENSSPREDGMEPKTWIALKNKEQHHNNQAAHDIYCVGYAIKEDVDLPKGFQNMNNLDRKSLRMKVNPRKCPLKVMIVQCGKNEWFTTQGTINKAYESTN